MKCLQLAYKATLRSVAVNQAENLLERLRANHSSSLRMRELKEWNAQNSELLRDGRGDFNCLSLFCTVNIHLAGERKSIHNFTFIDPMKIPQQVLVWWKF